MGLGGSRGTTSLVFAQQGDDETGPVRHVSQENCCQVGCCHERVKSCRLAKVGANWASDNQWDCGGALARLRHGAGEHFLLVEFLVAELVDSGRQSP